MPARREPLARRHSDDLLGGFYSAAASPTTAVLGDPGNSKSPCSVASDLGLVSVLISVSEVANFDFD